MTNISGSELAIVIPAYKRKFFTETLESICNQTDKNFTLYIGDDCSPENLFEIVNLYIDKVKIVYKRFDSNIGGKDLVAQWHRCIEMVGQQNWIWLFSDDDVMDPLCVEEFYAALRELPPSELYHFNVVRIDENGSEIFSEERYPQTLSGIDFFNKLINFKIRSYAIEFIFSAAHFRKSNGFETFDLAWGSDHATWLKLSVDGTIKTIAGACVQWRNSGYNITSINKNEDLSVRKRNAEILFYKWIIDFFKKKSMPLPFSNHSANRWVVQGIIVHIENYGIKRVPEWVQAISAIQGGNLKKLPFYIYLLTYMMLKKIRKIKNRLPFFNRGKSAK